MKKILIMLMTLSILTVQLSASGTEPVDGDSDGKREVSTLDHLLWISMNNIRLG